MNPDAPLIALTQAASAQDLPLLRRLLEETPGCVNAHLNGTTSLLAAIIPNPSFPSRTLRLLECLLEHGADPNLPDWQGTTALMKACVTAQHANATNMAQVLLQAGANPTAVNARNSTALHKAASSGNAELTRTLAALAPLDGVDDYGMTAITHAASYGHLEVVEILLEAGADPRAADGRGLHMMRAGICPEIRQLVTRRETARALEQEIAQGEPGRGPRL